MMSQLEQHIILNLHTRKSDFELRTQLTIPGRGVTAIYGPSGCGKTTLLRAIAGLEEHLDRDSFINVNGAVWHSKDSSVPVHQRRVGYVFQEASLFSHLSVQGNLDFGRKRQSSSPINYSELIELLGLESLIARSPADLSGGERQRVAIARTLLANPSLLLMDEPLAALDQARKEEILPYLERLLDYLSIPMIYVSHALDEIVQLADHLLLMDAGKITAQGSVTEIINSGLVHTHKDQAFSLLTGTVVNSDDRPGLTQVAIHQDIFYLPHINAHTGQEVRLRLYARDISLCLDYPQRTSILNIVPATIIRIDELDVGQVQLQLLMAGHNVTARISTYSCKELGLQPEQLIYAQIKALALMK